MICTSRQVAGKKFPWSSTMPDRRTALAHWVITPSASLRLDPDPARAAWPTSLVARDVTYDGRRDPIAVIVSCIPESSVGWIAASSPARGVKSAV
jgi:hypothetical protein